MKQIVLIYCRWEPLIADEGINWVGHWAFHNEQSLHSSALCPLLGQVPWQKYSQILVLMGATIYMSMYLWKHSKLGKLQKSGIILYLILLMESFIMLYARRRNGLAQKNEYREGWKLFTTAATFWNTIDTKCCQLCYLSTETTWMPSKWINLSYSLKSNF